MTAPSGPVVLGYGGSPHSKIALAWAEGLACRLDLPLVVVVSVLDVADVDGLGKELAGGHVVDELERLLADSAATVTVRTMATSPGQALVRETKEAYVTVLGARTHGPLASMVRGSVSEHVTRHAHGPVVVVREPHTSQTRRVVVGIDESTRGRAALGFALDHASRLGWTVTALHATEDIAASSEASARELIADVARERPEVAVTVEVVTTSAGHTLADASRDAELVVVGSRGRSPLAGLLLGSVSRSMLEHAQCPVAVVH